MTNITKKPVGNPGKYNHLARLQTGLLAVAGVSLSSISEVFEVMTTKDVEHMFEGTGPSRSTVVQCLQELYQASKYDLATKMAQSTFLNVMIDATTDSARELLALHFASTTWRRSAKVVETVKHKAEQQVEVIVNLLEDLNTYQRELGLKETRAYHITSLTTDNTGSNTGENGVCGVLEAVRKKQWLSDSNPGSCPPLLFKGCEDHVVHLIATEFERRLILRATSWGLSDQIDGKRHASATALCHILARLRSNLFRRAFRAFVRKSGGKPPAIERYSETRYASVAILSLRFMENRAFILEFLFQVRSLLTAIDLEALKWLFTPEVMEIIRTRALFAAHVLLPVMKGAAKVNQTHVWAKELGDHRARMVAFAERPNLLESVPLRQSEGQHLLESHLSAKLEEYRAEVLKQMSAASASNTDSRHAIELADVVTEAAQEPEEPEEPEVEDGEIVDEYEEEELACGVVVCAHPTLDLSRPDDKRVATPNLQSRVLVHIADAAKSFLFMQEKHNANWSTGASHDFQATSRAVERMFAVTKDFLERNSQTRIEVLSPLAILHDIPLRDLHKIWLEFGNLNLRRKARKALKGCPNTRD